MARLKGGYGKNTKDVFGFNELEKSFERLAKRYPDEADRMLMAHGQALQKRVKQLTPVYEGTQLSGLYAKHPGKLRRSWTLKKVKKYHNGESRVVRIQSLANYAHLIESGHEIVTGGSSYTMARRGEVITKGKNKGKRRVVRTKKVALGMKITGVKNKGRVSGVKMLEKSVAEARNRFGYDAEEMLGKLIKSEGLDV